CGDSKNPTLLDAPGGSAVDGPPIRAELNNGLPRLLAGLHAVVAPLAQRLKIVRVMEFCLIALVRLNVVNDSRGLDELLLEAIDAQRMLAQLPLTKCGPALAAV